MKHLAHVLWLPIILATSAAAQPAYFTPIGDLPGGGFLSECWGLSGNGRVAVGGSVVGGSGFSQRYAAFIYVDEAGLTSIDEDASGASVIGYGVNRDGSIVAGKADHGSFSPLGVQAFMWTPGGGPVEFGDLPGGAATVPQGIARAVSADGAFIAGVGQSASGTEAWRYSLATGSFQPLGDLAGGSFNSGANAISGDGSVVVGSSISSGTNGQEAFAWRADTGIRGLGFLPAPVSSTRYSIAFGVSADGRVIVGQSNSTASAPNGNEAFRWTQATGMQPLGDLPGGAFQSWAYACNADGSVVVGRASVQGPCSPFGCGSAGRAFIWDTQHGMREVQQLLIDLGFDLTGWQLLEARGVSDDGSVIAGNGLNPLGLTEAWIARIPRPAPPCPADFNADGSLNADDLSDYITCYFTVPPCGGADFNGQDGVNADDLADYINTFFGSSC